MKTVYVNDEDYRGANDQDYVRLFLSPEEMITPRAVRQLWAEIKQGEARVVEANAQGEQHDFNSDIFTLLHETFSENVLYANLVALRTKIGKCTDYNKEPHGLIIEITNIIDGWRDYTLHGLIKSGFTQEDYNKDLLHEVLNEIAEEFELLGKNPLIITDSSDKHFIKQISKKALELTTGKLADYIEEVGMRKYFEGVNDDEIIDRAKILEKMLEISEVFIPYKEHVNSLLANIDGLQIEPCYQKFEFISQTIPVCCELKTEKIRNVDEIDLLSREDILQLLEKHDALCYEERGVDGAPVDVFLIKNLELLNKVEKSKEAGKTQERD